MTLQEIFENSLRLICAQPNEADTSDYEERAGYILANFCNDCAESDRKYRLAMGKAEILYTPVTYLELSEAFSLSEVFAGAASYYLAAMLILDENEDMSDKFFALYTDSIESIVQSLPAYLGEMTDRYDVLL